MRREVFGLAMRAENKKQVRDLRLFRTMSDGAFESLLAGSYFQRFPSHVVLIQEGAPADFLHVVITGSVELFSSWNGRDCTMQFVRPVSTFILAAVLKDAPYLMSARTIEQSDVLMIPSENLRDGMSRDSALSLAMVTELAGCYREVVKTSKNMKLRNAVERLANFLLFLDTVQGPSDEVILPFEKRLLASYLGMTPENLSRAFNTLLPYGVAVDGARIRFEKKADLQRLAKPTPSIDDPFY